jgi:hypothetical protein
MTAFAALSRYARAISNAPVAGLNTKRRQASVRSGAAQLTLTISGAIAVTATSHYVSKEVNPALRENTSPSTGGRRPSHQASFPLHWSRIFARPTCGPDLANAAPQKRTYLTQVTYGLGGASYIPDNGRPRWEPRHDIGLDGHRVFRRPRHAHCAVDGLHSGLKARTRPQQTRPALFKR